MGAAETLKVFRRQYFNSRVILPLTNTPSKIKNSSLDYEEYCMADLQILYIYKHMHTLYILHIVQYFARPGFEIKFWVKNWKRKYCCWMNIGLRNLKGYVELKIGLGLSLAL